jgi:hypothetical protein
MQSNNYIATIYSTTQQMKVVFSVILVTIYQGTWFQ